MYLDHDYDDGWFGGAMEIYIKTRIKNLTTGAIEYIDYELDYNYYKLQDKTYNLVIKSFKENSNYAVKVEVWEDDGYGTGDDDLVADGIWARVTNSGVYIGSEIEFISWGYSDLELRESYIDPNNGLTYYNYLGLYMYRVYK